MKDHVKYSRARDQLYGVKVAFRQLKEKMPTHHRTAPMEHLLELLETTINAACSCFEAGHVLEVLVNVYVPSPLPGFEEIVEADLLNAKFDREVERDWPKTSAPPIADWLDEKAERDFLFDEAGGNERND